MPRSSRTRTKRSPGRTCRAYGTSSPETRWPESSNPVRRLTVLERGLPKADGWAWIADESIWGYEEALALRDGPWEAWTLHPGKCRGEDTLRQVTESLTTAGSPSSSAATRSSDPGRRAVPRGDGSCPHHDAAAGARARPRRPAACRGVVGRRPRARGRRNHLEGDRMTESYLEPARSGRPPIRSRT